MTAWAIVAIPREDDSVWKYSSEKIPHMTMLFLGEQELGDAEGGRIAEFISHVASTSMEPFGMSVERRGLLGDEDADVLFFSKDQPNRATPNAAREFLLTDPGIKKAYDSVDQYPEWISHLTMGYPKNPAKEVDDERPIRWVEFDKIALWTGDFVGPTFQLKPRYSEEVDMIMSEATVDFLQHFGVKEEVDPVDKVLAHFGIKGMRWGRRMANPIPDGKTVVTQKKPGTKVTAEGGKKLPASADAKRAAMSKQRAKASTTDALSNAELKALIERMNMEQQYSRLTAEKDGPVKKFLKEMFWDPNKKQVQDASKYQVEQQLSNFGLIPKKESNNNDSPKPRRAKT